MKVLIIAAICLLAVSAKPQHDELVGYTFEQYVEDFQKSHLLGSSEYHSRKQIFETNLNDAIEHNSQQHSWKKGVNKFTDMTDEEFQSAYFGNSKNMRQGFTEQNRRFLEKDYQKSERSAPKSFDWREHGVVTPPKDQGHCGSCWAFASTETVESQAAVRTGKLMELAPQQLTSCVTNGLECGGTGGCSGSIAQIAFTYVELFGMTTSDEYPYTSGEAGDTGTCSFNKSSMSTSAKIMGHATLPFNDEDALIDALLEDGPIAISAWASPWKSYDSGIFNGCSYEDNIDVNHAIQLVGYTPDYLLVRNSWGNDWGERGYIFLERTPVVECGVDSTPLHGAACVNDGQTSQVVCGQCGCLSNSATTIGAEILN